MEVPLIVLVAVLLVAQVDVMLDPGAKMSTQVPKLENDDRASVLVVEPTVMAAGTRAGDELQAFALEFPAATAKVTVRAMAPLTAESSALLAPPPRLMLATAGRTRLFATQFTPAITPELLPEPLQLSTRTGCSRTALATP